eukprot:9288668-Lingulodinium_polyedra.AAC.1
MSCCAIRHAIFADYNNDSPHWDGPKRSSVQTHESNRGSNTYVNSKGNDIRRVFSIARGNSTRTEMLAR